MLEAQAPLTTSTAVGAQVVQAGVPGLPFGGVGASGIGRCHGETGFRSLSNQKSVYQRPFALDLAWRYPPYGNRLSLLKRLLG